MDDASRRRILAHDTSDRVCDERVAAEYSSYACGNQQKLRGDLAFHRSSRAVSVLRWIVRSLCFCLLILGAATIYHLTEQSAVETSTLSADVGSIAERGAYLVQSGLIPAFKDNPIKWTGAHILLLSVKFSNHGLSVRQQAHVVEFALLGGVVALNVLAWGVRLGAPPGSVWSHSRVAHVAHVCAVHARMCCGVVRGPISQALRTWQTFRQAGSFLGRIWIYSSGDLCIYSLEYRIGHLSTHLSKVIRKKLLTRNRPLGYSNPRVGPVAQLVRASG